MKEKKFIATEELGKLAKWLRILGYDCAYQEKKDPAALIINALRDKRVILTRSSSILKYKGIRAAIVRSDHVEEQVDQIVDELGLVLEEGKLFRRCVECNTLLRDLDKKEVRDKVPEYVFRTHERFKLCPRCDKIFWKGTHWDMVGKWLEEKGIGKEKNDRS